MNGHDALSVLQGITVMYMPGISPQLDAQHASKTGALTLLENTGFLTLQSANRHIFGMPWLEASHGQVLHAPEPVRMLSAESTGVAKWGCDMRCVRWVLRGLQRAQKVEWGWLLLHRHGR